MSGRDVDEWFRQIAGEGLPLAEELGSVRPRIASARFWEPKIDLIEEEDGFLIKAEIAGVKGQDIEILYLPERHSLIIRGVRYEGDFSDGNRQGIHQLEIYYGEFQREIKLPNPAIAPEAINARYRNGFLYVLLPKRDTRIELSVTVTNI